MTGYSHHYRDRPAETVGAVRAALAEQGLGVLFEATSPRHEVEVNHRRAGPSATAAAARIAKESRTAMEPRPGAWGPFLRR